MLRGGENRFITGHGACEPKRTLDTDIIASKSNISRSLRQKIMAEQFTYDTKDFADETWAEQYHEPFDDFIELRIKGIDRDIAIITAFEMIKHNARLHNVPQLSLAAETNPYFRKRFESCLKGKDPNDFWDSNKALNALLKLIESPTVRDSTKLNVIRELNVLLGITELDEKGGTKLLDKSLADFYRLRVDRRNCLN